MPHKTNAAEGNSAAVQNDAGQASIDFCQYTTDLYTIFLCDVFGGGSC
jgi:hypothetical protein